MQANYWRKAKTIHQGQADDLKKEVERYRAHCERLGWETGTPTIYSEDLKKCISSSPLKIYLPILK